MHTHARAHTYHLNRHREWLRDREGGSVGRRERGKGDEGEGKTEKEAREAREGGGSEIERETG